MAVAHDNRGRSSADANMETHPQPSFPNASTCAITSSFIGVCVVCSRLWGINSTECARGRHAMLPAMCKQWHLRPQIFTRCPSPLGCMNLLEKLAELCTSTAYQCLKQDERGSFICGAVVQNSTTSAPILNPLYPHIPHQTLFQAMGNSTETVSLAYSNLKA